MECLQEIYSLGKFCIFFAHEFKLLPQSTCGRGTGLKGKRKSLHFYTTVSPVSDCTGTMQTHLVSRNVGRLCLGSHLPCLPLQSQRLGSLFEVTFRILGLFCWLLPQNKSLENFSGPGYFKFLGEWRILDALHRML